MNAPGDSPGIDERRDADQRLVHAMLLHIHDEQAATRREARVQSVMLAAREIGESPATMVDAVPDRRPTMRAQALWLRAMSWRTLSASAAVIAIAVGAFMLSNNTRPALASVNQILTALKRPGDRTFRINVDPADTELKHGLNDATLYLRDGQQYLLVRLDHKGRELFDGYDGHRSWRIRAGVLVEAREGQGAGGIPMPRSMAELPFVDLQGTLESIQSDYVVERFDAVPLKDGGPTARHLFARRKSARTKEPKSIEIWADPQSGTPQRIVFDDAKFQGSAEPRRLTFDLVSEAQLPSDWFGHAAHERVSNDGNP